MSRAFCCLCLWLLAAVAQAADAPFLWEVQGAKAKHYLMGSVHLLPDFAYPLPPALDAAYAAADILMFESDLAELAAPQTQMQMLVLANAPGGLKAQIGASLYQRVQAHATRLGLPDTVCDSFKAWFCALTLEALNFQQSGYRSDLGLDQHYFTRAGSERKSVLWLEEPAAHLKLFTAMPDSLSVQMLAAMLDEESRGGSPQELLRAWQDNDTQAMEKLTREFRQRQPQLYERLLAARNRAWMERLAELFGGSSSGLVIVGAAHLVGSDGLVAQLRARGYAVTPVQVQHNKP